MEYILFYNLVRNHIWQPIWILKHEHIDLFVEPTWFTADRKRCVSVKVSGPLVVECGSRAL